MTRVSIVTISFNQAKFLERTIQSVLAQDYPDLEYIMVDPGSTDGSLDIVERYRSRISKVILRPDQGAADGLNHGFAQATGEVYGYLNSDDLLLPGAVSSAVRFLDEHRDIDVVCGHANLIGPDDRFLRRLYSDHMSIKRALYGGVTIIQPSAFFRTTIFNRAGGFSANNRVCWDSELFLEMALVGGRFSLVDEFWSGYRVHQQSVSNSNDIIERNRRAQAEIRSRVKGRGERKIDRCLTFGHRILRHVVNPRDTWERILRGPVAGRVFD